MPDEEDPLMPATAVRTRRSAIVSSLALGAMLALATPVAAMHLDLEQSCTALVATEGGEPGPSATVMVGESVEIHGLFPRGENPESAPEVRVRLDKDGVEQDLFTVEQDEHDEIFVILVFEPGDEGQWQITAFAENTGCGGPADVTVLAAGAASAPTAVPSPTPAPTPAAMPDTAGETGGAMPVVVLLLGGLVTAILVAGSVVLRHRASSTPPGRGS
jgi:hypothetical protein